MTQTELNVLAELNKEQNRNNRFYNISADDLKNARIQVYCVGAKWFDKVNGNTYNNVKIIYGDTVEYLGFAYGYGSYYRQRAEERCIELFGDNFTLQDLGCAYYLKRDLKNNNF